MYTIPANVWWKQVEYKSENKRSKSNPKNTLSNRIDDMTVLGTFVEV